MSEKINSIDQAESGAKDKKYSVFMNINIAGLRCAQLKRGAHSRLASDSLKRKNTSIAIEEVAQGLVNYTFVEKFFV